MNKLKIKVSNIALIIIYVRIDYCISLLYSLSDYCLNRLPQKKSSAVHIFCKLAKFLHIKLMDFHCLPVRQRSLNFNLLSIS